MSELAGFQKSFTKFLHKKISKECKSTCKSLSENSNELSRDDLMNNSVDENYSTLVSRSPVLMTVLHGACCTKNLANMEVLNIALKGEMNQNFN